jgi:hypothetical protein
MRVKADSKPVFRYEEDAIARAVGVVRQRLHKARMLLEPEYWGMSGGSVVYSKDGVLALLECIGVGLLKRKDVAAPGKLDAWGRKTLEDVLEASDVMAVAHAVDGGGPAAVKVDGEAEGLVRLVVVGLGPNPGVLKACVMGAGWSVGGTVVRVLVKGGQRFVKGDEVVGRAIEGRAGFYRMVGEPVRKG